MQKKIDGYISGFGSAIEMDRLENYYDKDFTDAGMTMIRPKIDLPSREECERLCQNKSGPIIMYNIAFK